MFSGHNAGVLHKRQYTKIIYHIIIPFIVYSNNIKRWNKYHIPTIIYSSMKYLKGNKSMCDRHGKNTTSLAFTSHHIYYTLTIILGPWHWYGEHIIIIYKQIYWSAILSFSNQLMTTALYYKLTRTFLFKIVATVLYDLLWLYYNDAFFFLLLFTEKQLFDKKTSISSTYFLVENLNEILFFWFFDVLNKRARQK